MPDAPSSFDDGRTVRLSVYAHSGCLLFTGVLLTLILVPLSFSKVEYYQAGLSRQRSTNKVDKDKVYSSGNHFIGPDYTFETFQISAIKFDQRLSVWSKSSGEDAGSSLYTDVSFQYQLDKDELGELYSRVATNYKSLISTKATDAIKNSAPLFGIDKYLNSRERIERVFEQNVSQAISDVFASVVALQLRDVIPTVEYQETRLEAAVQEEKNLKEDYIQQATLVRETTDVEVLEVENEARAVQARAEAQAISIEGRADSQALQIVDEATSQGLLDLFTQLNLTSSEGKSTLDYLTSLMTNVHARKFFIGFSSKDTTLNIPLSAT